jgi:hypothetical protein
MKRNKEDEIELDYSPEETFYTDDVRKESAPKKVADSGERYKGSSELASALKSVVGQSSKTKEAVKQAPPYARSNLGKGLELDEGGRDLKPVPMPKIPTPGEAKKPEYRQPPKREYDEFIKSTSPKYQANEARYQKMLKSSGGSPALAYKRAKAAGDKGASEKFMKMMKEISKRPVKR